MTLTIRAHTLLPGIGDVRNSDVSIDDGVVVSITDAPLGAHESTEGPEDVLESPWVLPGAVDLHCHGGGGASLMADDLDEVRGAVEFHRRHGTAAMLVSLVSAPVDRLCRQLSRLGSWLNDPTVGLADTVAGIHLEGPFLSRARCGALDPGTMIDASPQVVEALIDAAQGWLRVVTVAPERPGVLEAIPRFTAVGVVVAVGHTDASAEVVHDAIRAGARLATHLGNGMAPFHHREPGAFGACATDPDVTCELIADGHHLHPDTVRLVLGAKAPERVTLCTDAVAGAGVASGHFDLSGQPVTVEDGVVRLDRTGALAGSTLTMERAVANLCRWGVSPVDVVRAASTNPARLIARTDRGVIQVGGRADLMLFDDDWTLRAVVSAGEIVWRSTT